MTPLIVIAWDWVCIELAFLSQSAYIVGLGKGMIQERAGFQLLCSQCDERQVRSQ